MADITFSAGMDSDGMEKAYQRMIRENGKLREELTKLATESRAAADKDREYKKLQIESIKRLKVEQEGLAAAAAKIMESVRTPFERYKKNAEELRQHLQAGRIDTDTYRKALSELAKEYKRAESNTEAARAAQAAESAELREAAQVIDKIKTKQERYAETIEKLNRLRDKGRISSSQHAAAVKQETDNLNAGTPQVETFGQSVAKMAAGWLTANAAMEAGRAAVALLRDEYDRLIERQQKAADAQLSLAGAQENALANLDTSMSPEAFLKRMRDESQNLGMSEKDLTTAAANALSAKGDKTASDAIDAVVAAARFKRFGGADEQAGLAGTALDLGKAFNMTPEQSLGFLAQAQGPSRVVSAKGMAENIAPGIMGAAQFGVSKEVAASIAAALSSTAVDVTGAKTQTTMSSLMEQLRSFGGSGSNVEETLALIQKDKSIRDEFLANASFEKQMIPAVEGLLTGGTQTYKEFQNAQKVFGEMTPQQAYDRELAKKNVSVAMQTATLDQKMKANVEQQFLADPAAAQSAIIRENMASMRLALGESGLSSKVSGIIDDVSSGGTLDLNAAIESLQSQQRQLTAPVAVPQFGTFAGPQPTRINASEEAQKQSALLQKLIDQIVELKRLQEGNKHAGAAVARRVNQGESGP